MNKVVINSCFGGFGLSEKARNFLKEKYNLIIDDSDNNDEDFPISRHDLRLVDTVETLGKEASDEYSKLTVVEIEEDRYIINEYDGWESIDTPNSISWIIIEK